MTPIRQQLDRLEQKVNLLLRYAGLQIEMEEQMDEVGTQLQQEIEKLNTDEQPELTEIKAGGEAVAAAGAKFVELKALLEKQLQGALSDEEAEKLTSLADEVDTHLGEADAQLAEHVKQLKLNEETIAA